MKREPEPIKGLYECFPGKDSRKRLWKLITLHKEDDPLKPITVISPSTYLNLYLRHQFGKTGFANVRFMNLSRFAELIGSPDVVASGLVPLSITREVLAISSALQSVDNPLRDFTLNQPLLAGLRRTFRTLGEMSESDLTLLKDRFAIEEWLSSIYDQFRENTKGFYTRGECRC
jgi:hypothetical protein